MFENTLFLNFVKTLHTTYLNVEMAKGNFATHNFCKCKTIDTNLVLNVIIVNYEAIYINHPIFYSFMAKVQCQ